MTDFLIIIAGIAGFILLIYLLCIKPGISRRPDMSVLIANGGLFAHRGLFGDKIKENTAEAFQAAVDNRYGIEFDIRLSADKIPVVIHDLTLLRVFGSDRRIDLMTSDELAAENVPMLSDVLKMIAGKVPLIAEIKAGGKDISVCSAAAEQFDNYKGIYCIESFNPLVLMWYKKHRPDVIRGQLSTNFFRDKEKGSPVLYFILQHLLFNFLTAPDFISYKYNYRSEPSLHICRKLYGIPAAVWTIKNEEELNSAERKKFDMYIFEELRPYKNAGISSEIFDQQDIKKTGR